MSHKTAVYGRYNELHQEAKKVIPLTQTEQTELCLLGLEKMHYERAEASIANKTNLKVIKLRDESLVKARLEQRIALYAQHLNE